MERVRDAMLPPGSLEWRVDRLPDNLKREHLLWRERCDAIILAAEKRGGGTLYELMLAGDDGTPPMPPEVARTLWPNGQSEHRITKDMSVAQASEIYRLFLEEGVEQ